MEKIDIVELLHREKEGKMPKRIEINGDVYIHTLYTSPLGIMYVEENNMSAYWRLNDYTIDTKIKILDKPIIEEIPTNPLEVPDDMIIEEVFAKKINEIIRRLNNGLKTS